MRSFWGQFLVTFFCSSLMRWISLSDSRSKMRLGGLARARLFAGRQADKTSQGKEEGGWDV